MAQDKVQEGLMFNVLVSSFLMKFVYNLCINKISPHIIYNYIFHDNKFVRQIFLYKIESLL
jgi:hypothetical protein